MSKETVVIFNPGFSVADAENVTYSYDGEHLYIHFVDWQENQIKVKCENTFGFKFQSAEYQLSEDERFDSVYLVYNSQWIEYHKEQDAAWSSEEWKHYKLNFNECCVIEVLCSKLDKVI